MDVWHCPVYAVDDVIFWNANFIYITFDIIFIYRMYLAIHCKSVCTFTTHVRRTFSLPITQKIMNIWTGSRKQHKIRSIRKFILVLLLFYHFYRKRQTTVHKSQCGPAYLPLCFLLLCPCLKLQQIQMFQNSSRKLKSNAVMNISIYPV